MITTRLSELKPILESGSRPKGGVRNGLGEIPSLGAEHLDSQGGFNFKKLKKVSKKFYSEMSKGIIRKNDILIVKDGATTGKVSFVNSQFPFDEASINEHIFILRINEIETFPKYIFWHLFCSKGQFQILKDFRGATVGGISKGFLNKIEIPLPPLPEQKRIAAILDKAEGIRRKREEALQLADSFLRATFLWMFGDPVTNPKGWEDATLGDFIHSAKDGPHVSPKYSESGIPFLSTRHVRPGKIIWEDLKYISRIEAEKQWKKCKPEKGDILYTKGGTTGIAAVFDSDKEIAVWVHVALLKTNYEKVDSVWLENMLNTAYCYAQSQRFTHGITNQDLGVTRMVNIKMYSPPLGIQKKFSEIVKKLKYSVVKQIGYADQSGDLFNSLTQRAFRGEL